MSSPKPLGPANRWVPHVSHLRRGKYLALACATLFAVSAHADLPSFLQHIIGASTVESALFRAMHLPQADVLYPRPPREATHQLAALIDRASTDASLYALRARSAEQSLDFTAAESDWKTYATHAPDAVAAWTSRMRSPHSHKRPRPRHCLPSASSALHNSAHGASLSAPSPSKPIKA